MTLAVLADIGGTNIRFALLSPDGQVSARESWLTSLYTDFPDALGAYLDHVGRRDLPQAIAACAAGPLIDGRIDLTNGSWTLTRDILREACSATRTILVNDFTAVARAIPTLGPADCEQIGGTHAEEGATRLALGPGTGLGVACAIPDGKGGWIANPGEGGHADLACNNDRELAIMFQLMRQFGHVGVERVLSGPGLENLYLAIAALDGKTFREKPMAADIARAARSPGDPVAAEAVSVFTGMLGSTAGSLALTLGARGGVYIAGGIIRQWGPLFDRKLFRHRFEAKGRMRSYLAPIPCHLVTAEDLAFRGLAALLHDQR
ncbi:MAG: glucokinase [Alphaproteobacteria bacterium]|nr:glucokinase [Alphaproteobacteria bacterium]